MMRFVLVGILVLMAGGFGFIAFDCYRQESCRPFSSVFGGSGEPYGAPFALVDHAGAPITEAAFRGQPSAIFFGFTHCPEVCPTTLFELDGWLKKLGDSGKDIRGYFVSVDPERDTPDLMADYVGAISNRITGITGEPEKVHAMLKSFGIYYKKVEQQDGDYTMDHYASVVLLDGAGAFAGTIAYGENPEAALAKLRRLAAEG